MKSIISSSLKTLASSRVIRTLVAGRRYAMVGPALGLVAAGIIFGYSRYYYRERAKAIVDRALKYIYLGSWLIEGGSAVLLVKNGSPNQLSNQATLGLLCRSFDRFKQGVLENSSEIKALESLVREIRVASFKIDMLKGIDLTNCTDKDLVNLRGVMGKNNVSDAKVLAALVPCFGKGRLIVTTSSKPGATIQAHNAAVAVIGKVKKSLEGTELRNEMGNNGSVKVLDRLNAIVKGIEWGKGQYAPTPMADAIVAIKLPMIGVLFAIPILYGLNRLGRVTVAN